MAGSRVNATVTLRKQPRYLPQSLPLLLARRIEGQYINPRSFVVGVARQFAPKSLVLNPQILTPQTQNTTRATAITALHVDRGENRFVLAGGADAIISIYDLSKWGSEEYLQSAKRTKRPKTKINNTNKRSIHKPIASSQREPPRSIFSSPDTAIEIPSGHGAPISKVQWYPVDSGAFVSSSKDGSLLVWDTDAMAPVAHCTPFGNKGIGSLHLSPLRHYSAVVSSLNDPALKLVDIRSSAASHTLVGHAQPGVSSVQWAPHNDVVLASGGLDGTVRLWDIRKAGGRSCVAVLDQDKTHPAKRTRAYTADHSHLPKPAASATPEDGRAAPELAPNNYRRSETTTVASHGGPVSALSFGSKGDGHSLVSASQDGNIHVWDLRGNGHLQPLRFLAPGKQPAIAKQRKQTPMLLTNFGTNNNTSHATAASLGACWVGHGSTLLGFSLERGGLPQRVLQGHLNSMTAIDAIEATMQILTAGRDGMILTWGRPNRQGQRKRKKLDQDSW